MGMVDGRCPYCNCSLRNYDPRGAKKHLDRCRDNGRRPIYSGKPAGRPRTHGRIGGPD